MTVVVIIGDSEWMEPRLVDVPIDVERFTLYATENESKEALAKVICEATGLDRIDLEEAQVFELEPLAAERLKQAEWPETVNDAQAYEQNLHKSIVYAALAKGGPVKLECLEEE
jgi:hypothetical protein